MNYYEYIDDYVSGKLSESLKIEFEKAMSIDASLKYAVENYDDAKSISEGLLEIDIMDTISNIKSEKKHNANQEGKVSKPSNSIFTLRRMMAAASIIGLISIATWWLNNNENLKQELWNNSYSSIVDPDAVKSGDDIANKDPLATVKHYYARNYNEECIEAVEQLLALSTNSDTLSLAYLYLGDTYLKRSYHQNMNQWEEAISAFDKSKEAEAKERKNLAISLSKY